MYDSALIRENMDHGEPVLWHTHFEAPGLKLGKTLSNFLSIREANWTQAHNHLAHKRTLNPLAKLPKYSSQYFICFSSPKTMD